MKKLIAATAITSMLILSGCVTANNSKSLVLPASDKPVAVTATAQAKCYDFFFVLSCKLYTKLESTNGQVASDFPPN